MPCPTATARSQKAPARWLRDAVAASLLCSMASSAQASALAIEKISLRDDRRLELELCSTADHYYVLWFRRELNDRAGWFPVTLSIGKPERTTMVEPLGLTGTDGFYRISRHPLLSHDDLDGDGRSDVEELADQSGRLAPLNPAAPIDREHGVARIVDREMFRSLSYKGADILRDSHLEGLEFVKFYILDASSSRPSVYFMNTQRHRSHGPFAFATGLATSGQGNLPDSMRGEIVYHPFLSAPGGQPGIYRFQFQPTDAFPFRSVEKAHELLAANMPFLRNNLYYYPMPDAALPRYRDEKKSYDASRIPVLLDEDLYAGISFLPLNRTVGYGLLRLMDEPGARPGPRDVVVYDSLPNELPRVGGVITTVPQTPLSHVNLRAIQDGVPNAYIANAHDDPSITDLVGRYVRFEVTAEGYTLEEVSAEEVDAHFADLRPVEEQFPPRDLSVTTFRPLGEISFGDAGAFGVKTANLATLRTFGFEEGLIADGFGLPFYFYDEFMKFNGFYQTVEEMLANEAFRTDTGTREATLVALRKAIKKGGMPLWMLQALTGLQEAFPDGTPIRCRSSTNNEDLPGFSGAGLYDSYTHHPDEGHLSKSIKQVFASLWNFRAFEEREFYRIDHFTAAMGVLLHLNFEHEGANGVAVTTDPVYQTLDTYYLNSQVGEDLVTNPDEASVPEELLLNASDADKVSVIRRSNRAPDGELLLDPSQLGRLRVILGAIHHRFRILYGVSTTENFAMEIEFKVTAEGSLAVKQARPWIF